MGNSRDTRVAHKNAGEFTPAEWEAHKKEHPGADRADHTITKGDKPKSDKPKREAPSETEMLRRDLKTEKDPETRKLIKRQLEKSEQAENTHGLGEPSRMKKKQDAAKEHMRREMEEGRSLSARKAFERALMVARVAGEFTPAEWETHKKRHPGADRADHTITKGDTKAKKKVPSEIDNMREQLAHPKHYDLDEETIADYKKQVDKHDGEKAKSDRYEKTKKVRPHHRTEEDDEFMKGETKSREDKAEKEKKLRSGG